MSSLRGPNSQILISHRGNINGKDPDRENDPVYIQEALDEGYDVEVDVWFDNGMFLGHDGPEYKIDGSFFNQLGLWVHAKNLYAFTSVLSMSHVACFWHQNDNYTLTSNGWIWAYPGQPGNKKTVAVLPEIHNTDAFVVAEEYVSNFGGICSDEIVKYRS